MNTNESAYMQIYKHIKRDIVDGVYPYGTKIPSKRTSASSFGVSVITVQHAYDLLCDEGYIRSPLENNALHPRLPPGRHSPEVSQQRPAGIP